MDYPNIKEYSKETLLKYEKEVVGIYLSGHPLDDYVEKFKNYNFNSGMVEIAEKEEGFEGEGEDEPVSYVGDVQNDMKVVCGGIITDVRKTVTKTGNKEMGFAKLEDLLGTIDLTFFPNAYRNLKHLIVEDSMATIKGKLNLREGEKPTILVDEIIPWNNKAKQQTEKKEEKLFIKFDVTNVPLYNNIVNIINSYPGSSEVYVRCTATGNAFKMNKEVSISQHLLGELLGILPEDCVIAK